jgi:hypothetical protein
VGFRLFTPGPSHRHLRILLPSGAQWAIQCRTAHWVVSSPPRGLYGWVVWVLGGLFYLLVKLSRFVWVGGVGVDGLPIYYNYLRICVGQCTIGISLGGWVSIPATTSTSRPVYHTGSGLAGGELDLLEVLHTRGTFKQCFSTLPP